MKKVTLSILLIVSSLSTLSIAKGGQNDFMPKFDYLIRDKKLACEAILCLSVGKPPHECNPALKRFYSIIAKKPQDLAKKRQNFLALCPKE